MSGKRGALIRLVCLSIGLGLTMLGCSISGRTERTGGMRKPREIPEQRIAGEPGATTEYLAACRQDFRTGLREVFADIAGRVLAGEKDLSPEVTDRALHYYQRYFQVIKGNTNIRREDALEALQIGQKRQRAFHVGLERMIARFSKREVRLRITEAGHFEKKILWQNGVEAGCRIVTDREAELFAYPLMNMNTAEYMVPRSGPVAAQLIYLDTDLMLFVRHGEDPSEAFARAAGEIFGQAEDVGEEIEGVHLARLYEHHLEIVALKKWTLPELEELRKIYEVLAVLGGDPHDFTAVILVDAEFELPVLLRGEETW